MLTSRVLEHLAGAPAFQRRISVREYHRMIDVGVLAENCRVELLEGVLVQMRPKSVPHARAACLLQSAFVRALPESLAVRMQSPLTLGRASEPEPDLAVVRTADALSMKHHPRRALLVIEVAKTSVALDRDVKSAIYARGRVPEYWIVNTVDRCIEVFSRPDPRRPDPRSGKYLSVERVEDGGTVTPKGFKGPKISVRSLLGKPTSN
jgi:Uma2 family endonuclease